MSCRLVKPLLQHNLLLLCGLSVCSVCAKHSFTGMQHYYNRLFFFFFFCDSGLTLEVTPTALNPG